MSAVAAAAPSRLDRRGLGVLSFGHLSVDLAQGTVPALIPFLVRDRGYSYAAAGALLLFSSIGSSFLQPLLGAFADRIRAELDDARGHVAGGHRRRALGPVRVVCSRPAACS